MATKKSASKKTAGSEAKAEAPAAKKAAPATKVAAEKTVNVQASGGTEQGSRAATATIATSESSGETPSPVKTTKHRPTHPEIAALAYEKWEHSGRRHGHHEQHWHEAERELNQ